MNSNNIYENKYLHREGKAESFRLFGAFPDEGEIEFCLEADGALELSKAVLVIHSDGLTTDGEKYFEFPLEQKNGKFSTRVPVKELLGVGSRLFYYNYKVRTVEGEKTLGGEGVTLLEENCGDRQLLIYSSDFKTPDFLKGGAVYHIFVDRFNASGRAVPKEGTFINPDWDGAVPMFPEYRGAPLKNNEFFGGDIWGIIEKLDYLEELGVTTLYLSPIFEAASNHKYDTCDYMTVDSMFGGDKALWELCKECKKRNMGIILDGVFNHTGDDSIYFDRYLKHKTGACYSKKSPYYKWYSFKEYPDKYECWWDIDILPRVNSSDESYMDFILGSGGVAEKWMKTGVSGFRLDVADELSDEFLCRMKNTVRGVDPDAALIGEVWEDASCKIAYGSRRHYFDGSQLDSVMNYPLRGAVISFIKRGDHEKLRSVSEGIYRRYPKCVSDVLMNFLGTHDTERIITVLAGDEGEGKTPLQLSKMSLSDKQRCEGEEKLKCAFGIIAFMYGFPSVFYGDETGLEGYHDPFCRRPFPWKKRSRELESFFSEVLKLRREHSVFKDGLFEVVKADENLFVFKRYNDEESLFICVTREGDRDVSFESPLECIYSSKPVTHSEGEGFVQMPYSVSLFKATN